MRKEAINEINRLFEAWIRGEITKEQFEQKKAEIIFKAEITNK